MLEYVCISGLLLLIYILIYILIIIIVSRSLLNTRAKLKNRIELIFQVSTKRGRAQQMLLSRLMIVYKFYSTWIIYKKILITLINKKEILLAFRHSCKYSHTRLYIISHLILIILSVIKKYNTISRFIIKTWKNINCIWYQWNTFDDSILKRYWNKFVERKSHTDARQI